VIGICGFSGGKLKQMADYVAYINHDKFEVCENIHDIFGQFLAAYLKEAGNEEPAKVSEQKKKAKRK